MSVNVINRPAFTGTLLGVTRRNWLLALALTIGFTALLTVGRAYNSHDMTVWLRALMWFVICGLIVTQSLIIQAWIHRKCNKIRYGFALSMLLAIVGTVALITIEVDLLKYTPLVPKAHDPLLSFALFMTPPVLIVAGSAFLLLATHQDGPAVNPKQSTGETENAHVNWPSGGILLVHAQEHYLEIHSGTDKHLVRGTMRDAELRLKAHAGERVHRSWWIARNHCKSIVRSGRDYTLILKNGERIPVGRSRVDGLRNKGWPFS